MVGTPPSEGAIRFFSSSAFIGGTSIQYTLSRWKRNQWMIALARAYGMAIVQDFARLNYSTPSPEPLVLSPDGRPLVWLDTELDRGDLGPPDGVLAALRAAEPPVIRVTKLTKMMHATIGGERKAYQVEILVPEEELAHCCEYCGMIETIFQKERMAKYGGQGYRSAYWCMKVCQFIRRLQSSSCALLRSVR
jgi:hypothetical protein